MEEYLAYKRWWTDNVGNDCVPSEYAFERHVCNLGLHDLMETLSEGWVNRLEDIT
jgi:hypothetical protein